jgi:hypothetical protein
MRNVIKGAAVVAALLISAPAFAQGYGPGYGYGYDYGPGYSYGPAYPGQGYGYGPVSPDQGYGYGQASPGPNYPAPVYEGRSVAVTPANGPGDSVAWCESHYRSYNPQTGMYLGYDGQHYPCP